MTEVLVIETSELGDRTYVAHDGDVAVVVDPQRDIDRVQAAMADAGVDCAVVLETHIHNDYVSGGLELARRTGAQYVVAGADPVEFERRSVKDGDELHVGAMTIRVVATPGHTENHLAYVVDDGSTPVVFTGGSLLYGSVGRTDLVDPTKTEELTHHQFRSAHHLRELLPDEASIYPTHGFGSFCSSGSATGGASSTMGEERTRNDALITDDENSFVEKLIAGLTAYPAYYAHMGARNRFGAGPIDLSLPSVADPDEVRKRIAAGEWVVDLRSRTAFADGHLRGTVGVPLATPFATYLGWLIPWDTPLTLLSNSIEDITAAQRQLVRIGIDRPNAAAIGNPEDLVGANDLASYQTSSFRDPRLEANDVYVLDVRREDERLAGHLAGSAHIPLHELQHRLSELPHQQIWVHCASGYRASIAASLLDRAGFYVVLIDDDWSNAAGSGRDIVTPGDG